MYFVTFWCGKCQTGSVVTVQSQFERGTITIKFLAFCLKAIKTSFTNVFFALFIFQYQYPVKKTLSGIWQSILMVQVKVLSDYG
jgi:hypothetical protein